MRAATRAADVLDFLTSESTEGTEEPARLYLTCGRVLEALGDRRAPGLYGAAYGLLEEQATGLDEPQRQAFLQRLPAHRAVAAAWRAQHTTGEPGRHPSGDPDGDLALAGAGQRRGLILGSLGSGLALPQGAPSV